MKSCYLRVLLATIIAAAFATARPAAADTALGGAVGTSSGSDGGHTVTGTGTWELWGDQTLTIAFECGSFSGADAVSTSIEPPPYGGCVLIRNGTTIATAPGRGVPGPAAVTAGTTTFSLYNTVSLFVCWNAYASFSDGYHVHTAGCSNISIINSVPRYQPGDNITDDDVPLLRGQDGHGVLYAIGTGGQNESGRALCVTTTGTTTDCNVGASGTGTSSANDVSVSGTGTAEGGGNWVIYNPGAKNTATISVTGNASPTSCNTVVAVSVTGNSCGNTAVSVLGYSSGTSGREEACTRLQLLC